MVDATVFCKQFKTEWYINGKTLKDYIKKCIKERSKAKCGGGVNGKGIVVMAIALWSWYRVIFSGTLGEIPLSPRIRVNWGWNKNCQVSVVEFHLVFSPWTPWIFAIRITQLVICIPILDHWLCNLEIA